MRAQAWQKIGRAVPVLAGVALAGGCAKVVVQPTPAAALDLWRLELFYAGRLDPNLHYIVAVNRNGLNAQSLGPRAVVAGQNIAQNWSDALVWHDGVWTHYTGDDIRLNRTGEPFTSTRLTATLAWAQSVQPYLSTFGLVDKVLPRGGGKLTLELCKTFFALAEAQRSTASRCAATTGVGVPDKSLSMNFLVSAMHPDRNGAFNVLDALTEPVDFTLRKDNLLTSVGSASPLPQTPNINLTGHNTDYERPDASPADGVPDDINDTLGPSPPDTDSDGVPDAVETSLETDPAAASSFPLYLGQRVVLDELWHPADLTYWRLRQVQPNQI